MPTIKGSLNLVTDRPVDSISEVWVRARETRGQGDGLTVGVNDRVPVSDGVVEFPALPGAAVLVLVQTGMPIETLPMLVGDEAQQSLRLVVQAGEVAGAADKRVIEQLSAEIAANAARAEQYRTEAAASASQAQASQSAASKSASNAKTSETRAKTSETNAKTSETNAANSAASAESQQKSAWSHFNNAVAEAKKAADSATAAKTSETNAASSASASASSASSASTQAGKAATSATQAGTARDAAKASETAAAGSAAAAKTSETNSKQSETNAGDYAAVATTAATEAVDAMDAAALSAAAFSIYTGTGFPNGQVSAPVGSIYTDTAATNGAIRWVKTSSTGTTGWKVEYGDTGWRRVDTIGIFETALTTGSTDRGVWVRRVGDQVTINLGMTTTSAVAEVVGDWTVLGFTAYGYPVGVFSGMRDVQRGVQILFGPGPRSTYFLPGSTPGGTRVTGTITYLTNDPWPTSLPGTPA